MRLECQQGCGQAARGGLVLETPQHVLMAKMHAIKVSNGQCTASEPETSWIS
jgi:hypothetical protein